MGISTWKIICSMPFGFSFMWIPGYLINDEKLQNPAVNVHNKLYTKINTWIVTHNIRTIIAFITLLLCGYFPNIHWLGIIYYAFCAFMFAEAVSLILSVLTMLYRDIRKLVKSLIRMFMYFSPVIWECHFASHVPFHNILNTIMKLNPAYYIISGYRDSIFYGKTFLDHPALTLYFWGVVLILFVIGCMLMYKFKKKFIDLI
jgi:teichoic acid transport system permease protein